MKHGGWNMTAVLSGIFVGGLLATGISEVLFDVDNDARASRRRPVRRKTPKIAPERSSDTSKDPYWYEKSLMGTYYWHRYLEDGGDPDDLDAFSWWLLNKYGSDLH